MMCNVCGKTINDDARFCKYCGVPVVINEISNSENEAVEKRIELTDEDGNSVYFEFLDLVTYRGKEYAILLPEDDNADEVIILQVESLSDESGNFVIQVFFVFNVNSYFFNALTKSNMNFSACSSLSA